MCVQGCYLPLIHCTTNIDDWNWHPLTSFSHTHTHTHAHHTLSFFISLTHAHYLSLLHSHTHTLAHTLSLCLYLSLTYTYNTHNTHSFSWSATLQFRQFLWCLFFWSPMVRRRHAMQPHHETLTASLNGTLKNILNVFMDFFQFNFIKNFRNHKHFCFN